MAGTITNRGNQSWRLTYDVGRSLDGRRIRRTETFHGSHDDAERRLTHLLSQRDQGFDVEPHKMTVDEYLHHWLSIHKTTPQTTARYRQAIRIYVSPSIGTMRLNRVKPLHIQELLAGAEKKTSAASSTYVFAVLKMALQRAVRLSVLARNPVEGVDRPKPDSTPAMRVLEPAQIATLQAAAEGTDLAPVIALALATGARRGELLALKWSSVDLDTPTITIAASARFEPGTGVVYGQPKTAKSRRTIAIANDTAEMLRTLHRNQKERRLKWGKSWANAEDLVFVNEVGEPIPLGSFNLHFKRIVEKAGLAPCRFHDLRHTHGTLLAGAGINPKVVSDRLGHSDVKFTLNRYVTPTQDHQRQAAEAFSALLKKAH
ncbi:MAG: hypothetical protein C0506_00220 [Anaerolinea sp.]|nr:hypothetical protein [Anaerolinea sp.]